VFKRARNPTKIQHPKRHWINGGTSFSAKSNKSNTEERRVGMAVRRFEPWQEPNERGDQPSRRFLSPLHTRCYLQLVPLPRRHRGSRPTSLGRKTVGARSSLSSKFSGADPRMYCLV